jgi:hypothetical protein
MLWRSDPLVFAVASDQPSPEATIPTLDLNDVGAIARFVLIKMGFVAD